MKQYKTIPSDRFPYEAAFVDYKIKNDAILPETAQAYAGKLAVFFDRLKQNNLIFQKTNKITTISIEDIQQQFEIISQVYSPLTYNKIHQCLNQYYKFLIVELHLPVPPLTWAISTEKIQRVKQALHLDWTQMAQQILENKDLRVDSQLAFLLFSKGWSTKMMGTPDNAHLIPLFQWTEQEAAFLREYPRHLSEEEFLFINAQGNKMPHMTLLSRLSKALSIFNLPHKHGALRHDARVSYIAKHNLDALDIQTVYGFKASGRWVEELLKDANKMTQEND